MMFASPRPFREALDAQTVKVLLPTTLRSDMLAQIPPALRERALFSSGVTNADVLQQIDDGLKRIVSGETTESAVQSELRVLVDRLGVEELQSDARLKLIVETNTDLARGYGSWRQSQQQVILDEFPAWEFFRAEERKEPREWPDRWAAAGGEFFPGPADYPDGRMIALKNDPIWTAISAFGLPYAPFDFNSGMDLEDVDRDECERLGLLAAADEAPSPEDRGFNDDLQATPEVRSDSLMSALEVVLHGIARLGQDGVLRFVGSGGAA
jgi:hypothetical protein